MLRWNKAWIVAKKDLAEFKKNKIVISTLIGMPIIFAIVLPVVVLLPIQAMDIDIDDLRSGGFNIPLDATPEEAKRIVLEQSLEYFLPFFLIIPAMIPTIVASYSFVGEKLNRSLEPLLASPITDLELFIGKCIAVLIPSLIATWAAFFVFSAMTDIILLPWLGFLAMPNLKWILIMLLVAPLVCILSIEANVYISSRVKDVRAAEQLGALVILPLILLVILLSMGVIQINILFIPILTIVIFILDVGLFFIATKTFHRERILTEWK